MGRPIKEFDEDQIRQIEKLAELGCTDAEIYGVMAVSKSTFARIKDRDPRVNEALSRGKGNLNVKLRRMQIEMALSGSAPMLIHLGRALLGQGPKPAVVEDQKANPLTQFLPRAETIKQLPSDG